MVNSVKQTPVPGYRQERMLRAIDMAYDIEKRAAAQQMHTVEWVHTCRPRVAVLQTFVGPLPPDQS